MTDGDGAVSGTDNPRDDMNRFENLVESWRAAADRFRERGDEDTAGAIDACADELDDQLQTCNVPGCEEPLGDRGVWCSEHYQAIAEETDTSDTEEDR